MNSRIRSRWRSERAAWRSGLKTTYYLRTTGASNIEKATITVKKDVRISGEDESAASAAGEFSAEEKLACSLEARRLGVECEACQ